MTKITVTVGVVDGKPAVIKAPSLDPEDREKPLEVLTTAGGQIKGAQGSVKQCSEAQVVHNTKGVLRRRVFK